MEHLFVCRVRVSKKREDCCCLGRWDHSPNGSEFTCDHEYAGDVTCDHCKFGPDKHGLDPRYPLTHIANWRRRQQRLSIFEVPVEGKTT
jgi:hypothetical protein